MVRRARSLERRHDAIRFRGEFSDAHATNYRWCVTDHLWSGGPDHQKLVHLIEELTGSGHGL
jgi:hypothetical protein